ncbi:hypothetical protein [Dinghuibacter silviterrae]|uniref:Outer membrane protein with beta-barrel domain n=1 Tax=Dinghuibacter silviterrae TaxID=1539049 RepID=A0A4R8DUE2_9BACT|nr:hypothetical protein [Dinghuibacter silviterrae]TDX00771.1 hypothetical protein EDB95_1800 [Dinghuibacter silviterrae]
MKNIQVLLCLALLAGAVPAGAQTVSGAAPANAPSAAHAAQPLKAYGVADVGWATPAPGFLGIASGGLRHGRWSWGVATGLDNAGITSVPVLAETRWRLQNRLQNRPQNNLQNNLQNTLEVFQQVGANAVTQKPGKGFTETQYRAGIYLRGGLAWRPVKSRLWLSAGYRYRTYDEKVMGNFDTPGWGFTLHRHLSEWAGFLSVDWRWGAK